VNDTYTAGRLPGHWHRTLELPCGYQHFSWYREGAGPNAFGVSLNDVQGLNQALDQGGIDRNLYLYTQHEIFFEDELFKHTRTSPNWEGGMVTYGTCKHNLRTFDRGPAGWEGTWLAGLCPKHCQSNALLFVGVVRYAFAGNYCLGQWVKHTAPQTWKVKQADGNPRGDLYTPRHQDLDDTQQHDHTYYVEPAGHTRSVEFYKKSPGSRSTREDGKIPKWWRDLEYVGKGGRRPPCFVLDPCWVFSKPLLWSSIIPGRAVRRTSPRGLLGGLARSAG